MLVNSDCCGVTDPLALASDFILQSIGLFVHLEVHLGHSLLILQDGMWRRQSNQADSGMEEFNRVLTLYVLNFSEGT